MVSSEVFSSEMSWIEFRSKLADILLLAPSSVKVAYRFSVQPRTSQHMHLRNADDLTGLFEKAHATLAKLEKSKSLKEFYIELKDLDASGVVKQKGKKQDTKKKRVSLVLIYCSIPCTNSLSRKGRKMMRMMILPPSL